MKPRSNSPLTPKIIIVSVVGLIAIALDIVLMIAPDNALSSGVKALLSGIFVVTAMLCIVYVALALREKKK